MGNSYKGLGGVNLSGAGLSAYGFKFGASGGVTANGDANSSFTRRYVYDTSSGISLSGLAIFKYNLVAAGDGGVDIAGTALSRIRIPHISTGGITADGIHELRVGYNSLCSGGVILEGDAIEILNLRYVGLSGLTLDGIAISRIRIPHISSGGITLDGESILFITRRITSSGGMVTSGTSVNRISLATISGTGGIILSGASVCVLRLSSGTSGGVIIAGEAISLPRLYGMPSGGIITDGEAVNSIRLPAIPSGGFSLSGSSNRSLNLNHVVAGGITTDGTALLRTVFYNNRNGCICAEFDHTGIGGVLCSGDAIYGRGGNFHSASGGINISGESDYSCNFENAKGSELYWLFAPLAEEGGITFQDISNYSNSLTSNIDLNYDVGVYCANAQEFNGLQRISGTISDIDDSFSVSFWIKQNTPDASTQTLFSLGYSEGYGLVLNIGRTSTNDLFAKINYEDGESDIVYSNTRLGKKAWHHIGFTWLKGESISLYVDGTLVGSTDSTPTELQDNINEIVQFGVKGKASYYQGLLQDVRVSAKSRNSDWFSAETANGCDNQFFLVGDIQEAVNL